MAEVRIDELLVSAVQAVPVEVRIDELLVSAVIPAVPDMGVDRLYARGIAKLPASLRVDGVHAGGLRRVSPPTRFKIGYKEEVLGAMGDPLGVTLPTANYDLALGSVVSGNPEFVNLRLNTRKSSGYRRYSDTIYRRSEAKALAPLIDLDALRPTEVWPLNTTAQIIARINALFGTKLTDLDFVEEVTPIGEVRTLTAKDESFYFQPGSKITLGHLDQNERSTEIVGLDWTELTSRPFRVASTDFSYNGAAIEAAGNVTTVNSALETALLAALLAQLPNHGFASGGYLNVGYYCLQSAPCQKLVLPAVTTLPVDNSGFYNRAIVIDVGLGPSYTFKYLVFHYNI